MDYFRKKINLLFWGAILLLCLLPTSAIGALALLNYGEIKHGLAIGSLKIGGLEEEPAKEMLQNQINEFSAKKIEFTYQDKKWTSSPEQLGIKIDKEKTLTQAITFGQGGNFLTGLTLQTKALLVGEKFPLIYTVEQKKFSETLTEMAIIETPPKNASLEYDDKINNFTILPSQKGMIIDRMQLTSNVLETFNSDKKNIAFLLIEAKPQTDETALSSLKNEAENLIQQAPFSVRSSDLAWTIEKAKLADWITALSPADSIEKPQLTLNQNKIEDFLTQITPLINREPEESNLIMGENDEVKFATMPRDGQKLNVAQSSQKIAADILAGQKSINLVIEAIPPKINDQNFEALGFKKLLGRGESDFSGSTTNRKKNIAVGAAKLNGLVIKPGEEFSLSQNIGDIDAANGWVPELVIKGNQTIPEYGGGLCQVSTTLFRAAVISGLKITERHPHAYAVKYYNPAGFDATVYPPNPDLKFINDTQTNILMQSKISGNKLYFEIFGTPDGREVKIVGPTTLSSSPDGSKKTLLKQQIWRDGLMEKENLFYSNYKSPDLYPVVSPSPLPSPTPAT
jgi:vancomycin resistance protein YoaR